MTSCFIENNSLSTSVSLKDFIFYVTLESYMRVWYRHSGEPEVEKFPPHFAFKMLNTHTVRDVEEITSVIGDHHITHMWIWGEMTSSLSAICQRLTHLKIGNVTNSSLQE